jgi:hypothetical protein
VENNARDLEANWAPSDFDRCHRLSFSGMWEPFTGWQVGAYAQFQSGRPFSVYAFESGLLALVFQRLDFAPGASADTARQQAGNPEDGWFNSGAFVRANAAGNTPRNFLRGPSQKRVDLSLAKRFAIKDGVQLELRAEVFNAFNWVNLGMPQNNVASADFGTITNTIGGPRTSQIGLRPDVLPVPSVPWKRPARHDRVGRSVPAPHDPVGRSAGGEHPMAVAHRAAGAWWFRERPFEAIMRPP